MSMLHLLMLGDVNEECLSWQARSSILAAAVCGLLLLLLVVGKLGVDMGYANLFAWHPICNVTGFLFMSAGYVLVAVPRMRFGSENTRKYLHLSVGVSFIWRNHAKMGKSQIGYNGGQWDPFLPNLLHMLSGYTLLALLIVPQLAGGVGRAIPSAMPPLPSKLEWPSWSFEEKQAADAERGLLTTPAISAGGDGEKKGTAAAVMRKVGSFVKCLYGVAYWRHKNMALVIYSLCVLCLLTAPWPPTWGFASSMTMKTLSLMTATAVLLARSGLGAGII
ncbi:unnamed protein product [Amoebophrya sp. A25]|nr:unnamed protein product [Amoebophrya sp. A25]|eukprot:GSA25T00015032001.1